MKLRRVLMLCAMSVALSPALPIQAQVWPDKPIKLIVPFPPGGGGDNMARLVMGRVATELGQPIVFENLAGAGGNLDLPPLTVPTDWRSPGLKVNRSFVSAHCQQHRQRAGGAAGRIVPAGRVPDCCAA